MTFGLHRAEDIQGNNDHTPHASDTEAEPRAETLTIARKAKKLKERENQLVPRNLAFYYGSVPMCIVFGLWLSGSGRGARS